MTSSTVSARTGSEWNVEALDLEAYLERIDYDGPRDSSWETLRGLHRAHLRTVSWEIVDVMVGREFDLEMDSLQRKIVDAGYGGACVESNLLFAAALEQLGFPVIRYLARAIRGAPRIRVRAHAVLKVEAEGRPWLADVGFGDEGPLEPIPFSDGATSTVGGWSWRLDHDDGQWTLRGLHADGWFDVYSLREEVIHFVDCDHGRYWCFHRPPFAGQLIAQRPEEQARYVLWNRELTTTRPDGSSEVEHLDPDQVIEALRSVFRIAITDDDAAVVRTRLRESGAAR